MLEYVSGLKVESILADLNYLYSDNKMDIDGTVLLRCSKNVKGVEWGYGYEVMNRTDATAIQGGTHELMLRFILSKKTGQIEDKTTRKAGYNERN